MSNVLTTAIWLASFMVMISGLIMAINLMNNSFRTDTIDYIGKIARDNTLTLAAVTAASGILAYLVYPSTPIAGPGNASGPIVALGSFLGLALILLMIVSLILILPERNHNAN